MCNEPISVFMPFYNEEGVIEDIVKDTRDYLEVLDRDYELILVDDGSDDETSRLVKNFSSEFQEIKSVIHKENQGYGNALKSGFRNASNPLIAYMDGDGQFDIWELDRLLKEIPENDIVAGIRREREDELSREIVSKTFNFLVRNIFDVGYRDIDCGIKVIRREVLDDVVLKTDRTVDAELLVKADRENYAVKQLKVSHRPREEGDSEAKGLVGVRTGLILTTLKEIMEIREDLK